MLVYRRDGDSDGVTTDRLKAFHEIHGVTAKVGEQVSWS